MKTFLNLKQYLILFAAIFSLTSCLKSDDPAFQIYADGYVEQEVTERPGSGDGEPSTYSNQFTPVLRVQSYDYEPIVTCTVSGGTIMMSKVNEYGGIVWLSTFATPSAELPKNTYSITAINADNESAPASVSFSSITKEMKGKLNGSIDYDRENKKLSFSFNKVENATEYLVIARESRDYSLYQAIVVQNFTDPSEQVLSLEEATFAKNLVAGKTYYFTTIALIGSISTGFSIMQEGPTANSTYTKAE